MKNVSDVDEVVRVFREGAHRFRIEQVEEKRLADISKSAEVAVKNLQRIPVFSNLAELGESLLFR